jgi:predicted ABC-type ATPase
LSRNAEPPVFLIVAGPNGSGKSSAYHDTDIEAFGRSVWIINPDLLTARIREIEGLELAAANLAAVRRIEVWLEASIQAHQTVASRRSSPRRNTAASSSGPGSSDFRFD